MDGWSYIQSFLLGAGAQVGFGFIGTCVVLLNESHSQEKDISLSELDPLLLRDSL